MRLTKLIALTGLSVFVAGCGGTIGGGGSLNVPPPVQPSLAGTYVGNYEDITAGTNGTISFTITSAGAITAGSIVQGSTTKSISGKVSSSGAVSDFAISGDSGTATGDITDLGGFVQNGTLTDTNGDTILLTLLLNPAAPTGDSNSPFTGDYSGTVTNAAKHANILSFVVASTGAISGFAVVDDNGTPTLSSISGVVSSGGNISYTASVDGSTVTTFTGNVALLSSVMTSFTLTDTASDTFSLSAPVIS